MFGTLVYMTLDIGWNTTLWVARRMGNGIVYGIHYLLGTDESPINDILMERIEGLQLDVNRLQHQFNVDNGFLEKKI